MPGFQEKNRSISVSQHDGQHPLRYFWITFLNLNVYISPLRVYLIGMKFYEQKDPIERKIMLLKAVCGSTLIEGMEKAAHECREEIFKLQEKHQQKVQTTLKSAGQKD